MVKKIALVTGASRGIGRDIAISLALADYFVIGTATGAEGVAKINSSLTEIGAGSGIGSVLDLSEPKNISPFLEQVISDHGAPTVLINNAGVVRDQLILRMKPEDWDAVITTNLTAAYHLTKGIARGMLKARWGRILNISSVVASMGSAGQSNYAASKAGLEGFTRAMALELASRQVTVNAIAPGFIETDMTASVTEAQRKDILQMIPAARLGQTADVAALVVFLCSDAASYITGETIHVNGGLRMN